MDKKKTGELIKNARMAQGYTQQELGDLVGVSNKAVSRWENGDSFPDIGVLESLSNVLSLKIADIVLGKVDAEVSETAVDELVRVATLQRSQRRRKTIADSVWILLFMFLLFRGYQMRDGGGISTWPISSHFYSLIIILLYVSIKVLSEKKAILTFGDKVSCNLSWISLFSCIYIPLLQGITMEMVVRGKTPFSMKLSSVGPFINNQLIFLFVVNAVVIVVDFVRDYRERQFLQFGIYVAIASMHLSLLYSHTLHILEDREHANAFFVQNILFVFGITVVAIMATAFCEKKMRR